MQNAAHIALGTDSACIKEGIYDGVAQAVPWILDMGYTVLLVALLLAFMGQLLFGDFEHTMNTFPASISGSAIRLPCSYC